MPISFNVNLLPSDNTAKGAYQGSKASGEPAYLLGGAAFFAVKAACYAAREELAGDDKYFVFNAPATPVRVHAACGGALP